MRKFYIVTVLMLLASACAAFAQPHRHERDRYDWREQVRNERIAFLTAEMQLTSSEAEKFWPVYNSLQDNKRRAPKHISEADRTLDSRVVAGVSGKEVSRAVDNYLAAVDRKCELQAEGAAALRKVLPDEKVAKMYLAEEKFRREQIHRLHHRGPDNPPAPGRPGQPGRQHCR